MVVRLDRAGQYSQQALNCNLDQITKNMVEACSRINNCESSLERVLLVKMQDSGTHVDCHAQDHPSNLSSL